MAYEWNATKAAENFRKHGVSFEDAIVALGDPFRVHEIDERFDYGEERSLVIGMGSKALLAVTYTMRGENTRIISARKATPYERENYYRSNAS
jgi:uncharacterized DUF497 family protein